jgi:hypothetical protein
MSNQTTAWIECNGQGSSARECLASAADKQGLKLTSIVFRDGKPVVRVMPFGIPEWLCNVEVKKNK